MAAPDTQLFWYLWRQRRTDNYLVVQKADEGSSVVLVDRDVYVNHMENILKDNNKFEKVDIKTRTLNFQVNHEKRINEILKSLNLQLVLELNNIRKLKQLDLDHVFNVLNMAFVKFIKQLLMLVLFLDLYCQQLRQLINWDTQL